ncbi:hypothetical protein B0T18DRAFT_411000 [Schizothecium vesticola]|uniref:Uncharacterized protein n=1 Tax=Schizothecium vesticola TaxID=314040 RepID=A0AA40EV95_9PEZI|nr:hypothetical protein B0T18DRAFT_411000 [Schizothecium vesticola]
MRRTVYFPWAAFLPTSVYILLRPFETTPTKQYHHVYESEPFHLNGLQCSLAASSHGELIWKLPGWLAVNCSGQTTNSIPSWNSMSR